MIETFNLWGLKSFLVLKKMKENFNHLTVIKMGTYGTEPKVLYLSFAQTKIAKNHMVL